MTRAALTWIDGERLRVTELADTGTCTIGRQAGSTVDLSDPALQTLYGTVSRRHAEIRTGRGACLVAHLSRTNPTRVNGVDVPADKPRRLADHDTIGIGRLWLRFHDLAAADRLSGVICPACGRENEPSRADCWYDGTNLAGALSAARYHIRVACRLVAADDQAATDVYSDLAIPGSVARITVDSGGPRLVAASDTGVTVNGERVQAEGRLLRSGDAVNAAGHTYAVVVR
jgi:pSer/pThr/pTyr-binding forkhead associated (FHA) protein